jgi:hypothetical protein
MGADELRMVFGATLRAETLNLHELWAIIIPMSACLAVSFGGAYLTSYSQRDGLSQAIGGPGVPAAICCGSGCGYDRERTFFKRGREEGDKLVPLLDLWHFLGGRSSRARLHGVENRSTLGLADAARLALLLQAQLARFCEPWSSQLPFLLGSLR